MHRVAPRFGFLELESSAQVRSGLVPALEVGVEPVEGCQRLLVGAIGVQDLEVHLDGAFRILKQLLFDRGNPKVEGEHPFRLLCHSALLLRQNREQIVPRLGACV